MKRHLKKYFQKKPLLLSRDMEDFQVIKQTSTPVPKTDGKPGEMQDYEMEHGVMYGPFFSFFDATEFVKKVLNGVEENKRWRSSVGPYAGDTFIIKPMRHPGVLQGCCLTT